MRRFLVGLMLVAGLAAGAPPRVHADEALWRTFRGRVMFSDMALAPAFNFEAGAPAPPSATGVAGTTGMTGTTAATPTTAMTGQTMTSAMRRIERSTIEQSASGFWRIHMLAFLDHPAATDVLIMRAKDIGVPRETRDVRTPEQRQVRVFEVPVERGAREVRLDDFVVTEAMGFEKNVSYEMSLEAPPEEGSPLGGTKKAGKADVYAKGVITLR
jgi:hypothetical protein